MTTPLSLVPPSEQPDSERSEGGYVTLPISQEDFRDFMSGLLGSPQAINSTKYHPFEINRDRIRRIHELLTQRVIQQNGGTLIKFFAEIRYSDDVTVELSSVDELETYVYVSPAHAKALLIEWDFLVQFADKNVPEKQMVQLFFAIDEEKPSKNFLYESLSEDEILKASGTLFFRVEHTARTWGEDMRRIIVDFFDEAVRPISFIRRTAIFTLRFSYIFLSAFILVMGVLFLRYGTRDISNVSSATMDELDNGTATIENIHRMLQFLTTEAVDSASLDSLVLSMAMFATIISAVFLGTRI